MKQFLLPFPNELRHKFIRVGPCCRAATMRGGAAAPPYRLHRLSLGIGIIFILLAFAGNCLAGNYTNFAVSIYIPVNVVKSFADPQKLAADWARISRQLKVDKVYIEVQRDRQTNSDALLEQVKQFFLDQGVQVAGGMALSDGSIGGQFKSFCYTDPDDRAFIKSTAELAARHFDEILQDDFFFLS